MLQFGKDLIRDFVNAHIIFVKWKHRSLSILLF